jgi:hypothetical protein
MQLSTTISWQNTRLLPALVSDYLANNDTLRHLYEHVPTLDSLKSAMLARANFATDRAMLVAELNDRTVQRRLDHCSKRDFATLKCWLRQNTFTVTAAHQPALFLGLFVYAI